MLELAHAAQVLCEIEGRLVAPIAVAVERGLEHDGEVARDLPVLAHGTRLLADDDLLIELCARGGREHAGR